MLSAVPLFSTCSDKELRAVASIGTPVRVEEGRTLVREGARGLEFFLIRSGGATCTIGGKTVARYGPGDFFGDMSLLDQGPRTATVTTTEPTEVLVVDAREFGGILADAPSITRKMLVTLARRLRETEASPRH